MFRPYYKDNLRKLIESEGLNPTDFIPVQDDQTFKLEYKKSGLTYTYSVNSRNHKEAVILWTIYNGIRSESGNKSFYHQIEERWTMFQQWLQNEVKPYVIDEGIRDPWTFQESFINAPEKDNLPLEQELAVKLKKGFDLLPEHLATILKLESEERTKFQEALKRDLDEIKTKIDRKEKVGIIRKFLFGVIADNVAGRILNQISLEGIMSATLRFLQNIDSFPTQYLD